MKNGNGRFEFYLLKLEQLLANASKEKNPALWLYSNDARTPLFMLEGLAKLYQGMHDKKLFEKIKLQFKILEDALGAIDYYDCFAKEFEKNASIPGTITEYLHGQAREKIQRLNDLLTQNNWTGDEAYRIKKIRKNLQQAEWKEPKEEVKAIAAFYQQAMDKIKNFWSDYQNGFTEVETQLHSMRRKLRWLSIYRQALQGVVQLKETNLPDENIDKYLTKEVVNSPFNKMPEAGKNEYLLLFEKNYFLALSWIIAELGRVKDNGLRILSVAEAFQQTEGLNHTEALEKSSLLFGGDITALLKLLDEGWQICKKYFEEKNLDRLLAGVVTAKNFTVSN